MPVSNPTDLSLIQHRDDDETWVRDTDSLEFLGEAHSHTTMLFPENTANYVTFTAGGVANTFGAWAEIVDDAANKLSAHYATTPGHMCGILMEDLSVKDKRFQFEIAYGDDKTIILRHRFLSGEVKKLEAVAFLRVRAIVIPAGELVYYRLMCETAGATCEISFRCHVH